MPTAQVGHVLVEEPAGLSGAGVRDQQTDVEVGGRVDDRRGGALATEVDGDDPALDAVFPREFGAEYFEPVGGSGGEDQVESGLGELFGEGAADAGRSSGHDRPGTIG